MEFQAKYLALFLLFSVTHGLAWFWMGNLHKNIQLMLKFLNGTFLVLHFSYYTLMPDNIICNIPISADDATLYSKCYQAYDL